MSRTNLAEDWAAKKVSIWRDTAMAVDCTKGYDDDEEDSRPGK